MQELQIRNPGVKENRNASGKRENKKLFSVFFVSLHSLTNPHTWLQLCRWKLWLFLKHRGVLRARFQVER